MMEHRGRQIYEHQLNSIVADGCTAPTVNRSTGITDRGKIITFDLISSRFVYLFCKVYGYSFLTELTGGGWCHIGQVSVFIFYPATN